MFGGQGREINYRTTVTDATAAGVNSTLSSLGKVDDAYKRIEKRETEVTRESHELRKAFDRVAKSADPLARAQQRYNRDLDVAKRALREGAASTEEYDRAVKGLNSRLKQSEQRASGAHNQYSKITGALRTLAGVAAAAGLSLSAVSVGREAVETASSFAQQLANVSAVTSAVGGELAALGQQARELGASTVFSASEAAAGMENLGRAGFTTGEIIKSIGGTLDLAAAGQLGLARAAEISSGVLRGFNLDASEAGRVSDVLAKAAVSSNQQIEDLGEAMKFAAPNAKVFGISLEEATASVSKLADAGLKGGIGGRGFQALITRLAKNRDDIKEIIGDFDVAEEGLTSVLRRLGEANISNATAIEIFSAENLDIFTVLSTAALDAANGTDKLTESLKNAKGEAERIAKIQFSTFVGALDELGGARENLSLEFALQSGALDELETTVRSITDSLNSSETTAFVRSLGEDAAGALKSLRENWDGVVRVTQAATAAAVAYGTAAAAGGIVKAIAAAQSKIAVTAQAAAADRAASLALVESARAETAATAATLARTRAEAAKAVVVSGSTTNELARAAVLKQITALETAHAASLANLTRVQAGLAATNAAATSSMLRTIGAVTGLSGAFSLLANPITGIPIALGAATAAIVVYRKEIAQAVAGTDDWRVALRAGASVALDLVKPVNDAAKAFRELGPAAEATADIIADFVKSPLFPPGGLDQIREAIDLYKEWARLHPQAAQGVADFATQPLFPQLPGWLRDLRDRVSQRSDQIERAPADRQARDALSRQHVADNEFLGVSAGLSSEIAGLSGAYDDLGVAVTAYYSEQEKASIAARGAAEEKKNLADSTDEASDAEEKLTKKIQAQRASMQLQIANLKALNELRAKGVGENEIEALERRQALRKQNSDLSQQEFDRLADQYEAERQINELYEARSKKEKDLAEQRKKAAEDAAEALTRAQQRLADTATDMFVDVWRSFRRDGISAIDTIKDYFRNALDNVVGSIFQNIFDGIFVQRQRNSLGFSGGGINPLALASAGGSVSNALSGGAGVAPSGGGVAALVAQANGYGAAPGAAGAGGFGGAFGLASIFSGVNNGLNRLAESLANPIENLLGLGSQGGLALRGALKGAGTGLLVSQGVNLLGSLFGFEKGNTGATIGGTIGGIAGSFIPGIGNVLGSVIGSTAGKIFGALFAGKPSDKIGQTVIDPLTGRSLGTGQKDNSAQSNQNLKIAQEIGAQVSQGVKAIIELTGGSIADNAATAVRENLLNIAAGSRDGIRIGNQGGAGEIANQRRFENTEEGAQQAVAAGIEISLKNLKGGDAVLAPFVRSLAAAGEPVDSIVQKLGVLKSALEITAEPLSQWEQSVKDIKSAFEEALSITTKNSAAEKALTQARKDALAQLGSRFDKDIERQRLSLEAPLEGQALDLLDAQKQRIEDAKAISQTAAAEQRRLTKVLALNTAEWKQFIDQAASSPEALSAATAALQKYADELAASGADPSLINQQISSAKQSLAAGINEDTAQRLLNLANPALAQFNALLKEQQTRVNAATAVGANLGGVERLNALERQKFIEGLSDEDRVKLGDFLGIIEDQSGRLAFVLSDLRLAFGAQIRHADELAQAYENTASIWKAANDNVRGSLSDLRIEFRGGNLQTQLDQALQRFDSALVTSRDPGASEDARVAAQNDLGALGREAAQVARELYGTAPKFQDVFNRIEAGLETALGAGDDLATKALSDAEVTRASLDALNRIDNALNQPSLDLPVLEESRNHLADIANDNSVFVERLNELIELEKKRASQAAVSVDALSQISQPLTTSTGNPVQDAQAAQQVAAAVLRAAEAQLQAAASASEVQSEELQDLRDQIIAMKKEQETTNTLLRRIAEALENGAATTTTAVAA